MKIAIDTTDQVARALAVLKAASAPMVASDLGLKIDLAGSHETRRRHVRSIVKKLRDSGHWIVASLTEGLWLTDDEAIWKEYLEHRNIDAKRILGDSHKKKMLADNKGQGLLFEPRGRMHYQR